MTCEAWSVVVVPFPFTESPEGKFRPAVVLSTQKFNRCGMSIMAMVTSARHARMPGDLELKPGTAGLPKESLIRMKLFTLDNRLIKTKLGDLPPAVGRLLGHQLQTVLRMG